MCFVSELKEKCMLNVMTMVGFVLESYICVNGFSLSVGIFVVNTYLCDDCYH